MIAKIALFLVGAALTVSAQTNFDVLVCKNASYTNATIIRATLAYLVVTHNDGIAKVALTNLPNSLQQKYKYDPDKATAALAAGVFLFVPKSERMQTSPLTNRQNSLKKKYKSDPNKAPAALAAEEKH